MSNRAFSPVSRVMYMTPLLAFAVPVTDTTFCTAEPNSWTESLVIIGGFNRVNESSFVICAGELCAGAPCSLLHASTTTTSTTGSAIAIRHRDGDLDELIICNLRFMGE